MAEKKYIELQKAIDVCEMHYEHCLQMHDWSGDATADNIKRDIEAQPTADVVEVVKVAEILNNAFGNDIPCNFNNIDEWLPYVCEYANTCDCSSVKCWEQLIKHYGERRCENDS